MSTKDSAIVDQSTKPRASAKKVRNKKDIPDAGRGPRDTIKVWQRSKKSALFWRSLALFQMPLIAIFVLLSTWFFLKADTVLNIPLDPEPGSYSLSKLPDSLYINHATNVVNLLGTYQPFTARRQFQEVRKYLWEPGLTNFERQFVSRELQAVEETSRSQLFYADNKRVRVERGKDHVVVRIPGTRQKFISSRGLPEEQLVWLLKMRTVPRNVHNENGIAILDLRVEAITSPKA